MKRCSFFIDGFNFYHSIVNGPLKDRYKWLNYAQLARSYLPTQSILADVFYFTAYADWLPNSKARHKVFVRALISENVIIRRGRFKAKSRYCKLCRRCFTGHEEKQTDINIAIELLSNAMLDTYDIAIVVSGDTDLVPAIKKTKEIFPEKVVGVLFPPGMRHKELVQVCDFDIKLYSNQLKKFRFPDTIHYQPKKGSPITISCPQEYL